MCVCVCLHPSPSIDEIEWPDGDDALPLESQDLITKLLRQSPIERLGTGGCFACLVLINATCQFYFSIMYMLL